MNKTLLYCFITTALLSNSAVAHYPTLDCVQVNDTNSLNCTAAYSDGSVANNEPVWVLDYNDNSLLSLTTDSSGLVSFEMPNGEFYVRFDPGHEDPAEFDYAEL